jgi:hypothetical protein
MLYPIQMSYCVYTNDHPRPLVPGGNISLRHDATKKLFMRVSFEITENGAVCMTTVLPLTYISGGNTLSASAGDKITFPLDHDVVLCTVSVQYPRLKMRVVKLDDPINLDDPRAPTPPPERRVRGGTLPYTAKVIAPPPPQAPQAPRTDRLPSTLPTTPEPEAPPQAPKPPQAPQPPKRQKPKRQKRQDFYMVA